MGKGWRLEDLATKVGCSKPLLSNIEHGYVPGLPRQQKIADALGCPVNELWPED
jgi:transcriptional regulator with XRE-family HTH domain